MPTPLEDVDSVKRWLRERREAAGITQEELAFYMGESPRAVLNAERLGSPKHQLPRGYPFFRMLQRLGVVVRDAPVPAGPTLDDRLRKLEADVAKATTLMEEALRLLRATRQRGAPDGRSPSRGTGTDG